ncbi:MAG TPA: T9SS type A sorting domain-containing protein [Bacteroidia bacterium]|nr:T9SS type A sorting domain-containing protein [Bacteroidia bacterium]HRH08541.1 T9SS type A sorting domain-containing protein [Bacteroidia bacterium]HRH62320.1 T9SS type A sorting domain-containing protein [Bacteroidia bacterium]
MNKYFFTLGLILLCLQGFSLTGSTVITNNIRLNNGRFTSIDLFDTVHFDLSNAIIATNNLSFPVLISSDDTINSLDFSFKYNHQKFHYDSISTIINSIQPLAFYNPIDSTVRFTSNSFVPYKKDTAIIVIHFSLLAGSVDSSDVYFVKSYLNGNLCTSSISSMVSTALFDVSSVAVLRPIVYPNPVTGAVNMKGINFSKNATCTLNNLKGEVLFHEFLNSNNSMLYQSQIDNSIIEITLQLTGLNLKEGMYLLTLSDNTHEQKFRFYFTK